MQWEPVIGLEVHAQLATRSKLFSGASTQFAAEPNTQACNIDLGLPGILPVLNESALHRAIKFGLSIGAKIAERSIFARKNYFYPDLPKGYQISQYSLPIVGQGQLAITLPDGRSKTIRITRAHLEEDAGKSLHEELNNASLIDLNRAGIPLLEIVSEPDMRSASEAVIYLKTLHRLIRYLDVSDAQMQAGAFRCDINISMRPQGTTTLGTRAEIKNVNSFRFVERAIEYEIDRQTDLLKRGGTVVQETRQYDANKDLTRSMRLKETERDYRYFPDPDLLPVLVSPALITQIRNTLPELPWEKQARFQSTYQLSEDNAALLSRDIKMAHYFEATLKAAPDTPAKNVAHWILGDLTAALHQAHCTISDSPVSAEQLGALLSRITDQTISNHMAKQVFSALWSGKGSVDDIIGQRGFKQITDNATLEAMIDDVMGSFPTQLKQYHQGKDKLFGFFVGQVMKKTQGKANPEQVNRLLKEKLKPGEE